MYISVRDFMTEINGVPTDAQLAANIAGLTAALGVLVNAGGGTLFFPNGRWPVKRTTGQLYCLLMLGTTNVRLLGEGGSTLALAGDQGSGDSYMIQMRNCANVRFEHMVFSGRDATNFDEQTHHVFLGGSGAAAAGNRDIQFLNCHFIEGKGGDGIDLVGGSNSQLQERILIDGCVFDGCDRSGIGVQRGVQKLTIANCVFKDTGDQDIDFEPSGTTQTSDVIIANNHFVRRSDASGVAVTLTGVSSTAQNGNSKFCNNRIYGGTLAALHCTDLLIEGNTITGDSPNITDPIINLFSSQRNIKIMSNTLIRGASCGPGSVISIEQASGHSPDGLRISGNTIKQYTLGAPIKLDSVNDAIVTGNRITWHHTATVGHAINLLPNISSPSLTFAENYVAAENLADGITPAGTLAGAVNISLRVGTIAIGAIIVANNQMKRTVAVVRDANGLKFHERLPIISGNVGDGTLIAVAGGNGNALTAWCLDGTPGLHGTYTGTVDPVGNVVASQGSIYLRQNGDTSRLHFKSTATDATGWTAITVP